MHRVSVCARVHVCMHRFTLVLAYVCARISVFVCACVCVCGSCDCVCVNTCVHVCTGVHYMCGVYACVCVWSACECVCVCVCVCM